MKQITPFNKRNLLENNRRLQIHCPLELIENNSSMVNIVSINKFQRSFTAIRDSVRCKEERHHFPVTEIHQANSYLKENESCNT